MHSPWMPMINMRLFGVRASPELGTMFGINRDGDACLLSHLQLMKAFFLPETKRNRIKVVIEFIKDELGPSEMSET